MHLIALVNTLFFIILYNTAFICSDNTLGAFPCFNENESTLMEEFSGLSPEMFLHGAALEDEQVYKFKKY